MRPDDDLKLGKIIKLAGYRQDLVDGRRLLVVHWYRFARRDDPRPGKKRLLRHRVQRLVHGLLVVRLAASITSGRSWPCSSFPAPTCWIYLAVCLTLWWMAWCTARAMRVPQSAPWRFPLTVLMLAYIQWRTMLLNYYHNGIRWRDTHYSLAELRANKV